MARLAEVYTEKLTWTKLSLLLLPPHAVTLLHTGPPMGDRPSRTAPAWVLSTEYSSPAPSWGPPWAAEGQPASLWAAGGDLQRLEHLLLRGHHQSAWGAKMCPEVGLAVFAPPSGHPHSPVPAPVHPHLAVCLDSQWLMVSVVEAKMPPPAGISFLGKSVCASH